MAVECGTEQISNQSEMSNEGFDENKINAQIAQNKENKDSIKKLEEQCGKKISGEEDSSLVKSMGSVFKGVVESAKNDLKQKATEINNDYNNQMAENSEKLDSGLTDLKNKPEPGTREYVKNNQLAKLVGVNLGEAWTDSTDEQIKHAIGN